MAQSKMHLSVSEVLKKFSKKIWFQKPRDRDFEFKTLKAFISKIRKRCDGKLIDFHCSILCFDELIEKYE